MGISVFCDFDGTITEKDNIVNIMKQFAPPEWESLKDKVLNREITIQDGVGKMFSLLPVTLREDIIRFTVENARIRDGLRQFAQFLHNENIPLYIVGGGIDFFVEPILKEYGPFSGVYCNSSNFEGKHIEILWPHSCDDLCSNGCGCCKPSVIRKINRDNDFKIVIGDSVTDLEAAKQADMVIARDYLQDKCEEWAIPYKPFSTFYDCIEAVKEVKGVLQT